MSVSFESPDLAALRSAYRPTVERYLPEEAPFSTVFVDITHKCNMECANCYIPNRALPDFPAETMYSLLRRFPRRMRVRLVGAEPTVREDLPELINGVRALGHLPIILSNGLKLGRRSYVTKLKEAGLRSLQLSMNGGLNDEHYLAIDSMRCAARKLQALDNLAAERMNVTVGMILVRDVNASHLSEFLHFLLARREIYGIHLRSVGAFGRYINQPSYNIDELECLLREALGERSDQLECINVAGSTRTLGIGKVQIQLTEWPDFGSKERGRLTPDGYVEPMFESLQSNDGNY